MRPYRQQRKQDKKCASLLEQNEKITPLPSKRKKTNFAGFFVVKEQYGKSVPSHKEENNDLAPPPLFVKEKRGEMRPYPQRRKQIATTQQYARLEKVQS